MPTAEINDLRSALLQELLERVQTDRFPSLSMLDRIESLLEPEEVPDYIQVLLETIKADPYPSIDMLNRVQRFM